MSRCGLVCFGMQVHGSTPGDSQRVENVAIIDTEGLGGAKDKIEACLSG